MGMLSNYNYYKDCETYEQLKIYYVDVSTILQLLGKVYMSGITGQTENLIF